MTNEYTYLGLKLTPNTKFDIASQQLSEKAIHVLYKIRKQIDLHQLPPKLACKIFNSVISLIFLYNSEVWGAYTIRDFTKWDKTWTEKAHLKFCKLYLGVNRKASNVASRGELGKFPLLLPIIKRTLSYIINIYKLPDSSIAKLAFRSSKELCLKGKDSFYSNVVNFLKKHFPTLIEPVDLEKFITDTKINVIIDTKIDVIIDIIQNNYISEWNQQINNSSKLSFYSRFKKNYNRVRISRSQFASRFLAFTIRKFYFCESNFFNKCLNLKFLFFYKNICETIKKYLIYIIYLRKLGQSQRDEVYEEI